MLKLGEVVAGSVQPRHGFRYCIKETPAACISQDMFHCRDPFGVIKRYRYASAELSRQVCVNPLRSGWCPDGDPVDLCEAKRQQRALTDSVSSAEVMARYVPCCLCISAVRSGWRRPRAKTMRGRVVSFIVSSFVSTGRRDFYILTRNEWLLI